MEAIRTTDQYLADVQQVELVKRRLRPFNLTDQRVRLIFDPRATDEEAVEGFVSGVSSTTNMMALWRTAEDAEDTLRRRVYQDRNGEPGYLVSYELDCILDAVAT